MLRLLLALLLCLAPASVGAQAVADGFALIRHFSVERPRDRDRAAIHTRIEGRAGRFYGGLKGEARVRNAASHQLNLYIGLRPRLGPLSVDLGYSRSVADDAGGTVALSIRRRLGIGGSVDAGLRFEPETAAARTEARAQVRVRRHLSLGAGVSGAFGAAGADPVLAWSLNADSVFAHGLDVRLRVGDDTRAAPRAAVSLAMRF